MPKMSATLSCRRLHAVLVVQLALVASCTDPTEPGTGGRLTACPTSHGTVQRSGTSATWRRDGSPHLLEGDVTITGSLTIEAGTLVCASPDAALSVTDSLIAVGTASDSIRFLPFDASAGWEGLELGQCCGGSGRSLLRHARLEGGLIRARGFVRMENVLVERGGVEVGSHSGASLEDVVVRRSPGVGIYAPWRSGISLSAVRIEESAGIGLSLAADLGGSAQLTIDRPIRITGGASYPASVPVSALDELLGEAGAADSLTGNARDTLLVLALGRHTLPMTITPALAWRISAGGGCLCATPGPLHMEAGSTLLLSLHAPSLGVRDLTVAGNAGARASIIGAPPIGGLPAHYLALAGDSAVLRSMHLENVRVQAAEGVRVTMHDVTGSHSSLDLSAASAAALSNVRLHSGQEPGLVLGPGAIADGIAITASAGHGLTVRGAGVQLTSCTIGGNMGHGVLAESGDIRISECSLLPNGMDAAATLPGAAIDARGNWWGDPSGPGTANAGTVSGTVAYEPFLVTPPEAESDAATIEIVGASVVATSDTTRLDAIVRDANGNMLFEPVVWSALDASTAEAFAGGLVLGAGVGETTITATVNGNTAVQTSVTIQVVPGAPVFDWDHWQLDEAAADVWAHDGEVLVVSRGGRIFRFDGDTWSTEQITSADLWVHDIWGRNASDVYVFATDRSVPNGPRSRLFHYDGSAWTSVFDSDGAPRRFSGTSDGHLYLALHTGLMHYNGSSWEQIIDEPLHNVWARGADDVFYVAGYASTITVWRFDGTTSHDVGGPGYIRLWSAADVLLGLGAGSAATGLWHYHGPGDWRQLEGSAGIAFYDAAGVDGSNVFAIGSNTALRHYDGSVLRPVWVRGAPVTLEEAWGEHAVAVDGPYVYVVAGPSLLRGTRRQ